MRKIRTQENNVRGKTILYIDQYGNKWWARSVRELRGKIGGGRVSKMYCDKKDGSAVHTGYVVGIHWCSAYVPFEARV
jgi:hypothetical protein